MITFKALPACVLVLLLGQFHRSFGYDTLIYRSQFEARLVNSTVNSANANYFSLFLAINSDSIDCERHSATLNGFYPFLDAKLSRARTNKQKAMIIFKEVHARFFRMYEEVVLFDRIFTDGTYNCVTASMLYALVLDKYRIPYEVKEKPTHIYLVTFPRQENILFETTNPRGLYAPDEKAKRDYVEGLVAMKLITREHVNNVGMDRAFNEYYYDNQNISLRQLAGLQYYNQALALYHVEKNIDGAITSALKANILYPNTKNLYVKTFLIRESLRNANFKTMSDVRHLAEFASTAADVSERKYVLSVFGDLLDTKLIQQSEEAFVAEAYRILSTRATNETLKLELNYNYEMTMAHWYGMKGEMDEVLVRAERAYAINPDDARLQELVARAVALKSDDIRGEAKAIESLTAYSEKFPFLKSNKTFKTLMIYQYSYRAYSLFLKNSGDEGYKFLALLEEDLKSFGGNPVALQSMIGLAYAEAGAYHYRTKNFRKALEVLQKGLEIVPGHGEIQERIRIVEEEMKR